MQIKIDLIVIGERYRKDYGDIEGLAASIEEVGQLHPIGIDSNYRLIFGERRIKACQLLGRDTVEGNIIHIDSLLKGEYAENEFSKDWTVSERVAILEAIETKKRGRQWDSSENFPNKGEAAKQAGFGNERTARDATKVVNEGSPELVEAMDAGKVSVSAAADVATLQKEEQAEVVAKGEKEILQKAKEIRAERVKASREQREEEKRKAMSIKPPEGKYKTIVIDPPWEMEKIVRDNRPNKVNFGFEYPTMSIEEIKEFSVGDFAHDECHLFMWTTQKYLPSAFEVLKAWGFKYVFTMTWHKPGGYQPFGLPQYNSEFVLFGRKGGQDFLDTKSFFTAFSAPRREHSRKPDEFYELVKRVSPEPRIDVFSREEREGFSQYGNEKDKFVA